jgi:predicted nucleotide-binding protein (sugar kinase/HSP70/actin superfamily)
VNLPLLGVRRRRYVRGFRRSDCDRRGAKIGIPRVLNLYSTAPFFRAYFETLGLAPDDVVFSPPTTEEMWQEGGRYGSIDPCFPSKVSQAHVHELLFHAHPDPKRRRGPLRYIFYPCLTSIPTWLRNSMDTASCPIVAGNPNVVKAAFTKEVDFFARAGVEYVDPSLPMCEPVLLKRKLYETWGPRLGITEDESDFAAGEGFKALREYDRLLEEKGRRILEEVEGEGRIAILMIGRPYHDDPGINHGIPEEFQVLGYPILSMRSIPKDPAWLARFFGSDDPLDIRDVWPENYSANSSQKVWAARFAARHPNVALLDLSSFKCGHDAPTYGIIDKIAGTAKTPYSALHDIDANKPGGSIKIRVNTYAHRLKRVQEELQDLLEKRRELERRIEEKRRELLERRAGRDTVEAQQETP